MSPLPPGPTVPVTTLLHLHSLPPGLTFSTAAAISAVDCGTSTPSDMKVCNSSREWLTFLLGSTTEGADDAFSCACLAPLPLPLFLALVKKLRSSSSFFLNALRPGERWRGGEGDQGSAETVTRQTDKAEGQGKIQYVQACIPLPLRPVPLFPTTYRLLSHTTYLHITLRLP